MLQKLFEEKKNEMKVNTLKKENVYTKYLQNSRVVITDFHSTNQTLISLFLFEYKVHNLGINVSLIQSLR